jgi:hypothetical protein
MLLVRRTGWQRTRLRTHGQKIRCRVSKGWMFLGQNRSEGGFELGYSRSYRRCCRAGGLGKGFDDVIPRELHSPGVGTDSGKGVR